MRAVANPNAVPVRLMVADEDITDEALMRRYRDGDVRAFETLYGRHNGPLFRYFRRLVAPAAVAEELFQDVWASVIRARRQYEVRAKFTTWLYRLAHNRLIDHYRRTRTGVPLADGAEAAALEAATEDEWREPEHVLERQRLAQRLQAALARLPEAQREAFLLRTEGGLGLEEIAAVTGADVEAAKSRLRYAVAKLRRELAPEAAPAFNRKESGA